MTRKYWEDEDYFLIQANLIAWLEFCKGFIIVEVKKNAGKYPSAAFQRTVIDKAKECITNVEEILSRKRGKL